MINSKKYIAAFTITAIIFGTAIYVSNILGQKKTKDVCEDCEKMGYVLTALRDRYPDLRVYSFDYHFDVGAIDTLVSIYKVKSDLPALIINGLSYHGFHSVEELEEKIPVLKALAAKAKALEKSATSTFRD